MDKELLKTIPNKDAYRDYRVHIEIPEFTCLCPDRPDQPDFAEITITYIPDRSLIELKSLKYYMVAYRDKEIYHEAATNRILNDLVEVLQPRHITVKGDWNIRGGIKTIVEVEHP